MSWDQALPVLKALVIAAAAWGLGSALRGPLTRLLEGRLEPTAQRFLASALRPALLFVAVPPVLDALGVSMTSALAVLSAAGLAVAMGLRDSLSNVASGVILLTARPFRVGDTVTVAGTTGRVERITFLLVEILTDDGRRVSVTNDKVLGGPMETHAAVGRVRVEVVLRVPPERVDAHLLQRLRDAALDVVGEAVEVVPGEVDPVGARVTVRAMVDADGAAAVRTRLFGRLCDVLGEARVFTHDRV